MRAAAILGLGCSLKTLARFQRDKGIEWRMGMPSDSSAADVIVLFGGDGTVHRHLHQLVKLELPVLVVPAGSGNDFARALGLKSIGDALTAWRKFCAREVGFRAVDIGIITPLDPVTISATVDIGAGTSAVLCAQPTSHQPRYFCCVAGAGIDAEVSRRASRLPPWLRGHGGYLLSLLLTIVRFSPVEMKVTVCRATSNEAAPSWTILSEASTILAAFANTPTHGGGMQIAPRAKMDDGLLDLCVVGKLDRLKLLCLFPSVYFGKHLHVRDVEYFQACRLRLETKMPIDVYADGEFVCQTPIEITGHGSALKVITAT